MQISEEEAVDQGGFTETRLTWNTQKHTQSFIKGARQQFYTSLGKILFLCVNHSSFAKVVEASKQSETNPTEKDLFVK